MKDELSPIEEVLECPVCLTVPREGPLPSCPAGEQVIPVTSNTFNIMIQVTLFASPASPTSTTQNVQLAEDRCCLVMRTTRFPN